VRTSSLILGGILIAAAISGGGIALAAPGLESESESESNAARVEGGGLEVPGGEAEEPGTVDEIVIRGIRMGRLENDPSSFASEIRTEDFEAERKSLADLLSQEVGVQLRRFGGPGERSELSIRGSTAAQVAVLLDGISVNSVLFGGADLSQVCIGMVESIEVTRGGGSLQEGSGALGGVVNVKTRRPGTEAVNRATLSGGAFDTWEGTLHRSAQAKSFEYSLGYCGFSTAGNYRFARPTNDTDGATTVHDPTVIERVNNERVRHSTSMGIGRDLGKLGEMGHLRFRDYLTYSSHGEPGPDSGSGSTGGQNLGAHSWDTQNLAHLDWTSPDLGRIGSEIALSLYHRYQRNQYRDPPVSGNEDATDIRTEVSTLGFSGSDQWRGELLSAQHRLTLRLDAKNDSLYASDRADQRRANVGVMLREDARFFDERLAIVPGIRFDWTEGFDSRWLPSLGAVVSPTEWLRIRGNIEKSFRTPTFDELHHPDKGFIRGNPNLLAESARNADVGIELLFEAAGPLRDLQLSGGVFQNDIDDSIVWVTLSPYVVAPINTGPARVRGYEMSLRFALTDYMRFSLNHTGIDSEKRLTGLPLPGRAEHETNFRVELGESGFWKLVGELQHTGEIPVSESGSSFLPPRSVWNASASLNLASTARLGLDAWLGSFLDKAWLFVELDNIGDVPVRDAQFFPQPGRNAHAGIEVEW